MRAMGCRLAVAPLGAAVLVFFGLVLSGICQQTTTTDDLKIPMPRVVVPAMVFDPTKPPVYRCKDGLMEALAWSLGTSMSELGFLGSLLGGLGGLVRRRLSEATPVEDFSPADRIRHVMELKNRPAHELSVMDIMDVMEFDEKTSTSGVFYSLSEDEQPSAEFIRDHSGAPHGISESGDSLAKAAKFLTAYAAKALAMAGRRNVTLAGLSQQQNDDEIGGSFRRVLQEMTAAPLRHLALDLQALPKPVLAFLASKTFANFLAQMVMVDGGVGIAGAYVDIKTPNKNLIESGCRTFDFALESDILPEKRTCIIVNLVSAVLACRSGGFDKMKCENLSPANFTNDPFGAPSVLMPHNGTRLDGKTVTMDVPFKFGFKNLLEGGDLPSDIPKDVVEYEAVDMFMLFRSCLISYNYATLAYPCGFQRPPKEFIPGYKMDFVMDSQQEGEQMLEDANIAGLPWIFFNREIGGCGLVVIVRQTATQFDWRMDLTTNMRPFIKDDFMVHSGFLQLFSNSFGAFDDYFAKYLEDCPVEGGKKREVIVTGHSLGAGAGSIVSLFLADRYKDDIRVTSALFATPNAFNPAAAAYYAKMVNGRAVGIDLDPISVAPCKTKHGWPRCNQEFGVVYTGELNDKDWYVQTPGRIVVPYYSMIDGYQFAIPKKDAQTFASIKIQMGSPLKLQIAMNMPPALQIGVSHICGYGCYYSKFVVNDPKDHWGCTNSTCPSYIMPNGLHTELSFDL